MSATTGSVLRVLAILLGIALAPLAFALLWLILWLVLSVWTGATGG